MSARPDPSSAEAPAEALHIGSAMDRGDLRRRRAICASALALFGLYSLLLVPAVPSLIGSNPVLLEALRGSTAAMVAGGAFARVGQASLALALLAPLPTLFIADPFLWWAGRLWGPDVVRHLGARGARGKRRTDRAARVLERYGSWAVVFAYLLPIPSSVIYAAAGWTGMRLRRFLVLDLIGTVLWVGLIVGLGYGIGRSAVHVAHVITSYSLYLTIALVVGTFAVVAFRAFAPGRGGEPGDVKTFG